MADITTTVDPEQHPKPNKSVQLNRKTVLNVGMTGIAVLFLGLRGFSKEVKTPTGPMTSKAVIATYESLNSKPIWREVR